MLLYCWKKLKGVVKVVKTITRKRNIDNREREIGLDPFRIISDDEFERNVNAIIAYYQMTKGETKKRFVSQYEAKENLIL